PVRVAHLVGSQRSGSVAPVEDQARAMEHQHVETPHHQGNRQPIDSGKGKHSTLGIHLLPLVLGPTEPQLSSGPAPSLAAFIRGARNGAEHHVPPWSTYSKP